jgi:hypothetical protein
MFPFFSWCHILLLQLSVAKGVEQAESKTHHKSGWVSIKVTKSH